MKCNDRKLRERRGKDYKKQKAKRKKGLLGMSSSGQDTVTPIINSVELCLPTLSLQKSEPVSSYHGWEMVKDVMPTPCALPELMASRDSGNEGIIAIA